MGLSRWMSDLLRRKPKLMDRVPEVIGHVTDEHGQTGPLRRGWLKHKSLSPDQHQRITRLRDVLMDAYPMTLDGWLDGFMRDADPESEIQIIEACAAVYRQLTDRAPLSVDEKKKLYAVLCAVSSGEDGPQLAAALPRGRGLPALAGIVGMYREARQNGSRP